MLSLIVALLMLYMAYQNVRSLVAIPFGEWQGVHWMLAGVTLALVAAAIFCVVRYYKVQKKKQEEAAAKLEEEKARQAQRAKEDAEEDAREASESEEEKAHDTALEGGNAVPEEGINSLDAHDELEGYELLDITMVVPPEGQKPPAAGGEEEDTEAKEG